MTNTSAIIGFHLETSMHAGAGSQLDVIDLPIQRELPTEYPVVFGSAVKGALRAYATNKLSDTNKVASLFGPLKTTESASAGDMLVGDARLVLLPVRSLSASFYWVTCPWVLRRLNNDAVRLGLDLNLADKLEKLTNIDEMHAITAEKSDLFLEENHFRHQQNTDLITKLASEIGKLSAHQITQNLAKRLVLVSDDDFSYLAKNATPVTPHVRLDPQTKTTMPGALWYEETLPSETLLYSIIDIKNSRGESASDNGVAFKEVLENHPHIQIGGNETVGMGWCKMKWLGA